MANTNRVLDQYFHEVNDAVDREKSPIEYANEFAEAEVACWVAILSCVSVAEKTLKYLDKEFANAKEIKNLGEAKDILQSLHVLLEKKKFSKWYEVVGKFAKSFRLHDSDRMWLAKAQRYARQCEAKKYRRQVKQTEAERLRVRNEFIQTNLKLAIAICKKSLRRIFGMTFEDLIQEANAGLLKAVERFDPDKGFNFSTYASWWIRHSINRGLQDKNHMVRVPVHIHDNLAKILRFIESYKCVNNIEPSSEEISRELGLTVERVEHILSSMPRMGHLSLDVSVSGEDDDGRQWIDLVADPEARPTDNHTLSEEASAVLQDALKHLSPIQSEVLSYRFGFAGKGDVTLQDLGTKNNLSRERIRQIEQAAIESLRRHFKLIRKDVRFWER